MVGDRLKQIRKEKGLSQKELAELLDTSQGYISDIEKGHKMPGGDFLIVLSIKCGVDINWLLTGEGAGPEKKTSPIINKIERTIEALDEKTQKEILKYAEEKKQNEEYRRLVSGVINLEPKYVKQAGWISLNLLYLLAMPSMILLSLVAYKFIRGNTAIHLFSESHYVYIPWLVHVGVYRRWWFVFLRKRCISFVNFCKYQGIK